MKSPHFSLLLLSLLFGLMLTGCKKEEDPGIRQLQQEVNRVTEENNRLQKQIEFFQMELEKQKSVQTTAVLQPQSAPQPEMTVDRMKVDLEPLLKDVIKKMKTVSDTPVRGTQFGMRTEYDLKKAVYGLVRNEDPAVPYWAKVIVQYEKFLESETVSNSYGAGSVQFLFAYTNNRWVLLNYQ